VQSCLVNKPVVFAQHRLDVATMFIQPSIAEVFELADYHVLRGSHPDGFPSNENGLPPSKGPRVQRVAAGRVEVCFEGGLAMNEVEVPMSWPARLIDDDLGRRRVEGPTNGSRWRNRLGRSGIATCKRDWGIATSSVSIWRWCRKLSSNYTGQTYRRTSGQRQRRGALRTVG